MNPGQDDIIKLRERVRRIITLQRQLNEHVYRFSQDTDDRDIQRVLSDVVSRGSDNIQSLARLLAAKCNT